MHTYRNRLLTPVTVIPVSQTPNFSSTTRKPIAKHQHFHKCSIKSEGFSNRWSKGDLSPVSWRRFGRRIGSWRTRVPFKVENPVVIDRGAWGGGWVEGTSGSNIRPRTVLTALESLGKAMHLRSLLLRERIQLDILTGNLNKTYKCVCIIIS